MVPPRLAQAHQAKRSSAMPIVLNRNLPAYRILREEGVECSPCHLKVCPIDHRCMVRLEPARVVDAACELLA